MAARSLVLLLLTLGFGCSRAPQGPTPLTAEAKAYVRNLDLSGVEIKATEAFSGQQVVEILGNIANNGQQPVKVIEVLCVFQDSYGQVVLRERVPIVKATSGGLKPGEKKQFRLPFDSLPPSWNQSLPQLVIANIQFG